MPSVVPVLRELSTLYKNQPNSEKLVNYCKKMLLKHSSEHVIKTLNEIEPEDFFPDYGFFREKLGSGMVENKKKEIEEKERLEFQKEFDKYLYIKKQLIEKMGHDEKRIEEIVKLWVSSFMGKKKDKLASYNMSWKVFERSALFDYWEIVQKNLKTPELIKQRFITKVMGENK